jgi:YidC/Oxa1 family membrane protein insertase
LEPQSSQGAARSFRAFAAFLLFFFAWMWIQRSCAPPPAPAPPPASAPAAAAPTPAPAPAAVEPTPETADAAFDDQIVVETDLYRARFTTRGAGMLELRLKEYFHSLDAARDPAKAADPEHWLPLVAPFDENRPTFALRRNPIGEAARSSPMDTKNWEFTRTPISGGEEVLFRFADGAGRRFEKLFRFRNGRHTFEVELRFANDRAGPAQGTDSYLFLGASGIWDERTSPFQSPPSAVVTIEDPDRLKSLDASKLEDGPQTVPLVARRELAPFFGAMSNYFALAVEPAPATVPLVEGVTCSRAHDRFATARAISEAEKHGTALDAQAKSALAAKHETNVHAEAMLRVPFPAADAPPLSMKFEVFAGPRSPVVMRSDDLAPFRVVYEVEYGSWTSLRWINRVLLWWMRLMERMTSNWGVAIILLTVTVKVLLFPLNRLQSRTMEQFQKKMKVLQPQLEELKKKHKNNAQKLAVEQQKMMREHHVRPPIFGCLVVFLQMPVWYGLFQIMKAAPELRQAPFFGWISDLSAPDVVPLPFAIPFIGQLHLLPILMVVAWLVQNRMMPKATDPQQAQMQKMMNFFPFIFLLMLYKYASGQSLYMLVNSLLGMLQMKLLRVTPTN